MEFEEKVVSFIKALHVFDDRVEGQERVWHIIFPYKGKKWHQVRVTYYDNTYFVCLIDGDLDFIKIRQNTKGDLTNTFGRMSFGFNERSAIFLWAEIIEAILCWLKVVKKDWIKANKYIQETYPFNQRKGVVPHSIVRNYLKDLYNLDQELGKRKSQKFNFLVEAGYFKKNENITKDSMTSGDFFDYCKIAYLAGREKGEGMDQTLSGREMYKLYADGRDDGLLQIDPNSSQEFSDWIYGVHPKRTRGGHPWEIKRGGNTTHIDLYVTRPAFGDKEKFIVTLNALATSRLKEAICMFLGIYEKGIPITITDPEGIRKRLLCQDNIGIMPKYRSLHRAAQDFYEGQDVFDVMYFDDLGRYKRYVWPFITWDPLPLLRLKP